MVPKDVQVLIPGICQCVTFHGKTDFAEVIKVIDLEMGGLSWIIPAGSIQSHEFLKSENLLWLRSGSCDLRMT